MITSSTDMPSMIVTLEVRGCKIALTLQECREIITTLSHSMLPMDDETVRAVYLQLAERELQARKDDWK